MGRKTTQSQEIADIDTLLRSGDFNGAEQLLDKLIKKNLPRRNIGDICSLLRRMDKSESAIRLLKDKIDADPPREVLIEYCRNLQILGVGSEPLLRLARLDYARDTDALLVKAQALASKWNYSRMVTVLNQALISETDPYQKLIVHLNICSAALFLDQFEYGAKYSLDIANICKERQFTLLESHALELHSQCLIYQGQLEQADQYINLSIEKLSSSNNRFLFNKKKWKAVIGLWQRDDMNGIHEIQAEAHKNQMWEALRSIDFEIARKTKDPEVVLKLYFGTPSEQFREMLTRYFGPQKNQYLIEGARSSELVLPKGSIENKDVFGRNKKVLQLLNVMLSDFYRPQSLGSLFSALYPGESFCPDSSISKTKRLLSRARKALKEHGLGIELIEENRFYRLDNSGGASILIQNSARESTGDRIVHELKSNFGDDVFRAQDVIEQLECTKYVAQNLLRSLIESKALMTFGAGPSTVYYFPPKV